MINKGMFFFSPTSWSLPMFPVPRRSWFMVQMRPAFHHNCQYMRCVAFRSLYNYRVYRVLWCMFLFIHNEILYFVSTRIIEFCDVCMYIYSYTMRFCTLFYRTPSSLRFYKTAWISSIFLKKTTLSTSLWTPNQVSSSLLLVFIFITLLL